MKHFKYISKVTGWMACMALLLQVVGCNRGLNDLSVGEGLVSFSFEQNDDLTTKSDIIYTLSVVNAEGDTVAQYEDHRYAYSIKLPAGVYTIHAKDNNSTHELFGVPRYGAIKSVTVIAGVDVPVVMTCGLINVKVQAVAFDQAIQDNFTNYSLVVKPMYEYTEKDTLTFRQEDVTRSQQGWITQTPNHLGKGSFALIFRATNWQSPDKEMTYVSTISDANPADFYRFTVKMNEVGGTSEGGAIFRLSVHTDITEYEFDFTVKDKTLPLPVVTRNDGLSINNPMITNVNNRIGDMRVNIASEAGIRRLRIRHTDAETMLKYGLPGTLTLGGDNSAETDEAQRETVADLVTWSEWSKGSMSFDLDFSGLMNTAMLNDELLPEGAYSIELEVYDYDNQMITQELSLEVAQDFASLDVDLIDGMPSIGSTYAYLSAQWLGDIKPEGLGFEYRLYGTDNWLLVNVNAEDMDESKKSFKALLYGLAPETLYEFRPVGINLPSVSESVFMTDSKNVDLPNLDFEGGHFRDASGNSKDVYYAYALGESEFWLTGNEGGKYLMFGQGLDKNVTNPVTGALAHTGRSLHMKTHYVSKFGVRSLATGTMYSGKFGPMSTAPMNSTAQRALVSYGRPYTGRPLALKGWYRYISQTINVDIDSEFNLLGTEDNCMIYISLEAWGGASKRPDNPVVVGYGELKTGATEVVATDNGYVPFEFKINYTSVEKPTHIVMCATSSALSDRFCGAGEVLTDDDDVGIKIGPGSELYIDDFELIWEPQLLKQQ